MTWVDLILAVAVVLVAVAQVRAAAKDYGAWAVLVVILAIVVGEHGVR